MFAQRKLPMTNEIKEFWFMYKHLFAIFAQQTGYLLSWIRLILNFRFWNESDFDRLF